MTRGLREIQAVMVSGADGFGDLEPMEKVILHLGEDERVTIILTEVLEGTEFA
jgi:hypothetical protein